MDLFLQLFLKNKNFDIESLKVKKDQNLQENLRIFLKNIKPTNSIKFYIDVDPGKSFCKVICNQALNRFCSCDKEHFF